MTAVPIRALRRRLTVLRASEAADGAGGAIRAFVPADVVFAAVEPRRIAERVADGRRVGYGSHRIVLRHRDDVDGDTVFVDGDRRFRVLAVEDADAQRRFLSCLCEEERP